MQCPCGSLKKYVHCCEPYLIKKQLPNTPEALMRSRYTAFHHADVDYLEATMQGKALLGFDAMQTKMWAKKVKWIGLRVLNTHVSEDTTGFVEFEAYFLEHHRLKCIHELSTFLLKNGEWYYPKKIS